MLVDLHMLIDKEYLAIPKDHDKAIISLRTAYANEYSLDKEQPSIFRSKLSLFVNDPREVISRNRMFSSGCVNN